MVEAAPQAEQPCAVPATHLGVRDLAAYLRARCTAEGVDEVSAFDLELAMVEAANNIVEHGYGEGAEDGVIRLAVQVEPGEVALILEDEGTPPPEGLFSLCRVVPLDATEGRGIGIVRSCVDAVDYMRDGRTNRLRLAKALTA